MNSYGEEFNDLVHNLFNAYLTAKDSEFTRAIKVERRDFILGPLMADELLVFAETLYSLMIEDKSWGTHQNQEEQIVALTSEINLIKSQAASKKGNPRNTNKRNKGPSGDNKNTENNNNKNETKIEYADWMLKAPSSGQDKTKTVNHKKYWWCPHHQDRKGQWVRHKPEDHKLKGDDNKSKKSKDAKDTPKADVAAAVAEFLEREE